jgi:hypothetical protein
MQQLRSGQNLLGPREICIQPKMREKPAITTDGVYWWYERSAGRISAVLPPKHLAEIYNVIRPDVGQPPTLSFGQVAVDYVLMPAPASLMRLSRTSGYTHSASAPKVRSGSSSCRPVLGSRPCAIADRILIASRRAERTDRARWVPIVMRLERAPPR